MIRLARVGIFIVSAGLLWAVSGSARAAGDDNPDLTSPLGTIEWSDSHETVIRKVKKQMLDRLRSREDIKGDRVQMQRARKRLLDRMSAFEESYEKLDGDTNYQVSVISEEFIKDNGEAVMRMNDTIANRYYFFIDGGLYKMVVAYNQGYLNGVDFETFVAKAAKKYGNPIATKSGRRDGKKQLVGSVWKQDNTVLEVVNQREFFDTFTMSFAERTTAKRLAARRQSMRDDDDDDAVSSRVESLTSRTHSDADQGVVDSIVGATDVELGSDNAADEQASNKRRAKSASHSARSKRKSSKTSENKHSHKKKKKKKKRDFGDIQASPDGDDDLIIY